ncbi:hypothetical protein EYB26_009668 [Talaromyces marneffei]|uniref:Uncharacterized protein n=1 Tax=Talaromyces marneffei (strain ATCC 18224 / CBS 334.59 / QM 7333) TaxID=441960 RepID=B6QV53_TALMQ|nr:uncharacterized protein EYB26_009668 [Talaromyces marneffei]EEA18905.1 conserved hypothetical protein [Talaromyces marneffei ATCC 18224]QGA21954.1 hypothetical protein EYB26_009668 [Talaromyces marneffei]
MASAGLLMATVFFDLSKVPKKNGLLSSEKRQSFLQSIRPGDVLTLSFTAAVLAQGMVLVVIQSMQMSPLISMNCGTIGQIVFPALWVVGLVILVFGIETLYRGFQRNGFAPRKKMVVYICWVVIILLTGLTYIPTHLRRSTLSECSLGLLSIVKPWSDIALGITIALIVFYTLIASILVTQLFRATGVDTMERVAATQMVYYLIIATAVFTFFLPFWARITLGIPQGITPMMAIVSINVIGIVVSFFQLLFRSYTECMTIRYSESSRDYRWKNGLKRKISSPIAIPQEEYHLFNDGMNAQKRHFNRMDTDKSLPPTPTPTIKPKPNTNNYINRKPSYSIFPTEASARKPKYPASSLYEDEILLVPPRPAFAAHNRNSSDVSHATVQIGFRLSNLDPPPPPSRMGNGEPSSATIASRTYSRFLAPPPFSISNPNANSHISATSLNVPITLRSPVTERPNVNFPSPAVVAAAGAAASFSRPRSSTLPIPSRSVTSLGARSPGVYQKLDDLQKLLEVDLQAAQKAAADSEAWPLRDSLPGLLPQSTYHPD